MTLFAGLYDVPAGHVAAVITVLEQLQSPAQTLPVWPDGVALVHQEGMPVEAYRRLFTRVGGPWLWYSRLEMGQDQVVQIRQDPLVDLYILIENGKDIGILELDFRQENACELAFFGLVTSVHGRGLGSLLMQAAQSLAWSRAIERLWLHTCTSDGPHALSFYRAKGFVPFQRKIEIVPDPRHTGALPKNAGPHIPIL